MGIVKTHRGYEIHPIPFKAGYHAIEIFNTKDQAQEYINKAK